MIICGANDNAFYKRLPRESDLTLLKAISVGYAAEETRKRATKILQFQSTSDLQKTDKLRKLRLDDV